MWYGGYTSVTKKCFCLFDCQCDKVERAIAGWTSDEAFKTMKNRLLNLWDPTEIFARIACVLFYREILDGTMAKCTKDNLKKTSIAFSFACSFANEEVDCVVFYASCWQRFQQLVSELEKFLGHIRSRRRFPLLTLIDEIFPQDSDVPPSVPTLNSAVNPASSPDQVAGFNDKSTRCVPLETSGPRTDHPIVESKASPTLQIKNSNVPQKGGTVFVYSRELILSMSTEFEKKSSASEEENKKPQTREPMRSTIVNVTPVAVNRSSTAVVQETSIGSEKNKDTKSFVTSSPRIYPSVDTSKPPPAAVDKSNWYKCPKDGCEYKFKFEWMLERHANHASQRYPDVKACNECGMDFSNSKTLCNHLSVHRKSSNRFICEECDFYYVRYRGLRQHKKLFHKARES